MTHPVVREHDQAVREALETIGRKVGAGEAPEGALAQLLDGSGSGYFILYPIAGGDRDGPASDPYADITLHYQVTCIDDTFEGARWLADNIEAALDGLVVPNRSVMWVTPTAPSGIWRDDDTANLPLFLSTPSYRIRTTPA